MESTERTPVGDPARMGLADRVEALGVSIDIESLSGSGTRITARFPSELEAEMDFQR